MSQSLILVDHAGQSATATAAAQQLIDEALAVGALIGSVRTQEDNEAAVKAQVAMKGVRKQIEAAYRAAKDPIVQIGRRLDVTFKTLVEELDREDGRIGHLAGEFALAERRRVAAEQIAAQQALDKLEREKHEALAKAPDPVKQAQVLEDFSRRAAVEIPQPAAPIRAEGQRVREEWQIEVVDIIACARWALMTSRWDALNITIRVSAVKELLEGGMKEIPGLRCSKVPKGSVSLPRSQKAIEV